MKARFVCYKPNLESMYPGKLGKELKRLINNRQILGKTIGFKQCKWYMFSVENNKIMLW